MADETNSANDHDSGATIGHDEADERTTAPMSEFGRKEAVIGALVLFVGLVVSFGVPLLVL